MADIKMFVATKAFIVYEGKILLLRESGQYADGSNAGEYDVVGGRVEPGQRFDESLVREIKEETGLEVTIGKPFFVAERRPVVRGEQRQIIGTYFLCHATSDVVTLSEDHDDYQRIDPTSYHEFPIIENIRPVFDAYNTL